jgi:hypothetical protein
MLGALFQSIGYQLQLLAAPVDFPFGLGGAGFRALAFVHLDLGEEGGQPSMFGQNCLGLPVIGQGHCPQGAEMGADLAQHAAPGVEVDFQAGLPRDDSHRLPGADQGADVAFDAGLFIQAQLHLVHVHLQGQFQAVGSIPFAYLGKHRHPKSRKTTSMPVKADLSAPREIIFLFSGFPDGGEIPGLDT